MASADNPAVVKRVITDFHLTNSQELALELTEILAEDGKQPRELQRYSQVLTHEKTMALLMQYPRAGLNRFDDLGLAAYEALIELGVIVGEVVI